MYTKRSDRRMLSPDQARRFYDNFGARQDKQGWYEDEALADLIAHAGLAGTGSLLEFGCGTGRLAALLLTEHLPEHCRYLGIDISPTMLAIARQRLTMFGDRARLAPADGNTLPTREGGWDHLLSTYVLDLLPESTLHQVLEQAHRVLAPGGRLCLAGLTPGTTLPSVVVMGGWDLVHRFAPDAVGGCRPLRLRPLLQLPRWQVQHHRVVIAWGIASEVLVAERQPAAA